MMRGWCAKVTMGRKKIGGEKTCFDNRNIKLTSNTSIKKWSLKVISVMFFSKGSTLPKVSSFYIFTEI